MRRLWDALPARVRRYVLVFARPVVRAYVRYVPVRRGKHRVWMTIVESYVWDDAPFTARTRFGPRMTGNARDIFEQRIYYFGEWEPDLTAFLRRRLQPGDVFVDVGAHVGYYALLASRPVGPTGGVVAVEASPATYGRLLKNVALNDATNVRAVNMAAGRQLEMVTVHQGPASHTGITSLFPGDGLVAEASVEAAPLSTILTDEEFEAARIVKIDVEGAEADVVAGLEPLLERGRPDLEVVVEICPERLARHGRSVEDIFSAFEAAGMYPYALPNYYSAWNYINHGRVKPPERLRAPLVRETDVVFSRVDAASL